MHTRPLTTRIQLWAIPLLLLLLVAGGCAHVTAQPAPHVTPAALTSEQITAYQVVSAAGRRLGPADGLVLASETGTVAYLVVRLEDRLNYGKGADHGPADHFLLIPWSLVRIDVAPARLVVTADPARLDTAPVLLTLPDTTRPGWDAAIHAYWSAQ